MSLVGGNTYLRETYITVTDKKCNFSDMCSRERVSLRILCSGARISRGNTYHCNTGMDNKSPPNGNAIKHGPDRTNGLDSGPVRWSRARARARAG